MKPGTGSEEGPLCDGESESAREVREFFRTWGEYQRNKHRPFGDDEPEDEESTTEDNRPAAGFSVMQQPLVERMDNL